MNRGGFVLPVKSWILTKVFAPFFIIKSVSVVMLKDRIDLIFGLELKFNVTHLLFDTFICSTFTKVAKLNEVS